MAPRKAASIFSAGHSEKPRYQSVRVGRMLPLAISHTQASLVAGARNKRYLHLVERQIPWVFPAVRLQSADASAKLPYDRF
jgi:hypothetical protein